MTEAQLRRVIQLLDIAMALYVFWRVMLPEGTKDDIRAAVRASWRPVTDYQRRTRETNRLEWETLQIIEIMEGTHVHDQELAQRLASVGP